MRFQQLPVSRFEDKLRGHSVQGKLQLFIYHNMNKPWRSRSWLFCPFAEPTLITHTTTIQREWLWLRRMYPSDCVEKSVVRQCSFVL